jgi:hypothetical protein
VQPPPGPSRARNHGGERLRVRPTSIDPLSFTRTRYRTGLPTPWPFCLRVRKRPPTSTRTNREIARRSPQQAHLPHTKPTPTPSNLRSPQTPLGGRLQSMSWPIATRMGMPATTTTTRCDPLFHRAANEPDRTGRYRRRRRQYSTRAKDTAGTARKDRGRAVRYANSFN